jgi:hypothetical protein
MRHKIILFFFLVLLQVINVKAQKTKSLSAKNMQQSSANLKLQKKLDSIFLPSTIPLSRCCCYYSAKWRSDCKKSLQHDKLL